MHPIYVTPLTTVTRSQGLDVLEKLEGYVQRGDIYHEVWLVNSAWGIGTDLMDEKIQTKPNMERKHVESMV